MCSWKLTYAIQDSMVPNARSSASCALRTSSQLSIIHRSLIAEKYVESGRPVLRKKCQAKSVKSPARQATQLRER